MPSQQNIFPQKILRRNPKIDSLFLPTARPCPLIPLTHSPPPMYWLGTSMWCLGPVCMLHFRLNPLLFWPSCLCYCLHICLILLYILGICLTLAVWKTYGPLGPRSLPSISSFDWALLGCRPFPSCLAHLLSCVHGLIGWKPCHATALLLLYHYLSFISLLPMSLRANVSIIPVHSPHPYLFWALLANIPVVPTHFPCPYLYWILRANIPVVPTHFIHRASSAHLLLPYLFYSHGLLLNPLGFLCPITTSLALITFWAYWPLCQPNESTNSFLGLPRLIYFFFTSYYFHGFTTSLLGLPQPIYFLFTFYYYNGSAGLYSWHSVLLGLLYYFIFPFYSYYWASSAIRPFVKRWVSTYCVW